MLDFLSYHLKVVHVIFLHFVPKDNLPAEGIFCFRVKNGISIAFLPLPYE